MWSDEIQSLECVDVAIDLRLGFTHRTAKTSGVYLGAPFTPRDQDLLLGGSAALVLKSVLRFFNTRSRANPPLPR